MRCSVIVLWSRGRNELIAQFSTIEIFGSKHNTTTTIITAPHTKYLSSNNSSSKDTYRGNLFCCRLFEAADCKNWDRCSLCQICEVWGRKFEVYVIKIVGVRQSSCVIQFHSNMQYYEFVCLSSHLNLMQSTNHHSSKQSWNKCKVPPPRKQNANNSTLKNHMHLTFDPPWLVKLSEVPVFARGLLVGYIPHVARFMLMVTLQNSNVVWY